MLKISPRHCATPWVLAMTALLGGSPALAQAVPATQAPLTGFSISYNIAARGVTVGSAAYSFTFGNGRYTGNSARRATGLAKQLAGNRQDYDYAVSGLYDGSSVKTRSYRASGGRRGRVINASFTDTNVATTSNIELNMGTPPATAAQRVGVVDEVSMLAQMLVAGTPCRGTLKIYSEGRRRFDFIMSPQGTQSVNVPGFRGEATKCAVRFAPISGFSDPIDAGTMTFLFALVDGVNVPVQIEMPTDDAGIVRLRASRFSVTRRN